MSFLFLFNSVVLKCVRKTRQKNTSNLKRIARSRIKSMIYWESTCNCNVSHKISLGQRECNVEFPKWSKTTKCWNNSKRIRFGEKSEGYKYINWEKKIIKQQKSIATIWNGNVVSNQCIAFHFNWNK